MTDITELIGRARRERNSFSACDRIDELIALVITQAQKIARLKSELTGLSIDRHYSRQEQVERAERAEARAAPNQKMEDALFNLEQSILNQYKIENEAMAKTIERLKSELTGLSIDRHYSRQEQVERAEAAEARVQELVIDNGRLASKWAGANAENGGLQGDIEALQERVNEQAQKIEECERAAEVESNLRREFQERVEAAEARVRELEFRLQKAHDAAIRELEIK